jgi:peptidoglycan hydrolase CwlO-like protein
MITIATRGRRAPRMLTAGSAAVGIALALLGSGLTTPSSGDLQSQIASNQSAADSLKSAIAAETSRIHATTNGLGVAQRRLSAIQGTLAMREADLIRVQNQLLAARNHLVGLENRLQQSSRALASNLVATYEGSQPDVVTVILESHGFSDLLEKMSFLQRIGHQDAQIVRDTRAARTAVAAQANSLASLEARDRALTDQVLAQRNQVAALQGALLNQRIAELGSRASKAAELDHLNSQLKSLEAQAAKAAQRVVVGGISVNPGGMVQPPTGAPTAVGQVMAAGNAIATLPYIWGGGHGSFQANGYDCSGSVSYALAAAGLLSSPLDSTGFESWGDPGAGRWITVYANADHAWMTVAGWRFDTVALASGGTRWSQSIADPSGFVVRHPPGL